MSPQNRRVTLRASDLVSDSPMAATSMSLPVVVHRRLDLLAGAAQRVRASRAEIVAMLIAEAKLDDPQLEQRILDFRGTRVGTILPGSQGESEIVVPLRPPGRPRRSA